ncbi:ankyrin [Apiospora saccharicola]|uniref:Ankyrin n=1 Tax=Apiospora saccharicola TaxID=335842 RepID=A0ABR1TJ89_9PEZI
MTARFAHSAVVVCEAPIDPAASAAVSFHVETTSSPSAPVLFTFSIDTADREPPFQITPDRISSLTRTIHDHTTQLVDSPPRMELVRQLLGSTRRNLLRLHFQLRNCGQLVSPAGGVVSEPQKSGTDIITLLAGTSVFSVYMPHDALPKATYNIFFKAVRPFLGSAFAHPAAAPERPQLLPTVDQDDCHVYDQKRHSSSPPIYVNEDDGRTPGSHESDNDTVAVTTPSGYGPIDDDEELPGYPESEDEHFASAPANDRKRHFRGSSEESRDRATSKRGRLWSPDAQAFVETESPSPSVKVNLDYSNNLLVAIEARMRLQDERIEKLDAENRQCNNRNVELERRVAELEVCVRELQGLESRVDELGEQHEVLEETVANMDVYQSELEADCSRVGLELAEIRDMSRDAIIDEINEKVQDSIGDVVVMYREELRRKLISTLQDT